MTAKQWNADALEFYRSLGAAAETVVAHALFGEAFDRLIDEDAPPPIRQENKVGGGVASTARRIRPRTRMR